MASPDDAAPTVFLCHSSGDKERVRDLYRRLTGDGVTCWFDEEDLEPGQDWDREIRRALIACRYVLACLSNDSISKTGYVQKELSRALDRADEQPEGSVYLVPVRLELCDVPDRLRRWQRVDLFREDGYERLLRVLRPRLTGPAERDPGSGPAPTTGPSGAAADRGTVERDPGRVPRPGQDRHSSAADGPSRRGPGGRAWAALLVVALVSVVVAAYSWGGLGAPGGRPDGASSPTTAPGELPSTAPAGEFVLFDDFSGSALDPARWTGADDAAPTMTVADGVLRAAATGEAEGTDVDVHAAFPRAVEAVRFVMTVQRVDGSNDGGAHARLTGSGGRLHEIWGGPRGDGAPTIGYAICQTETRCSGHDAFTRRGERLVPLGRPSTVVVRRGGEGWEVSVDGEPWTRAAVERGPIEALTLGAYSFGRGFSVDFDDVYVAYA